MESGSNFNYIFCMWHPLEFLIFCLSVAIILHICKPVRRSIYSKYSLFPATPNLSLMSGEVEGNKSQENHFQLGYIDYTIQYVYFWPKKSLYLNTCYGCHTISIFRRNIKLSMQCTVPKKPNHCQNTETDADCRALF